MPNLQPQRQELSARSTLQISAIVRRGWTLDGLTASRRWEVVSLGLSHQDPPQNQLLPLIASYTLASQRERYWTGLSV